MHRKTNNDVIDGELGVYPIQIAIKCKMINFWMRIILDKESKLSNVGNE